MYKSNKTIDKYGNVIYTCKNSANQIVTLKFYKYEYTHNTEWFVCFYIGKRKKGFQYLQQTGKDGISSLLWAKRTIKDFIEELKNSDRLRVNERNVIRVQWDNSKRRDVYTWGLKDLGFRVGVSGDREKALLLDVYEKTIS